MISLGTLWHHPSISWRHIFRSHFIPKKKDFSLIDCFLMQSGQDQMYLSTILAGLHARLRPLQSKWGQLETVRIKLISFNQPHSSPSCPCWSIGRTTRSNNPPWSLKRCKHVYVKKRSLSLSLSLSLFPLHRRNIPSWNIDIKSESELTRAIHASKSLRYTFLGLNSQINENRRTRWDDTVKRESFLKRMLRSVFHE